MPSGPKQHVEPIYFNAERDADIIEWLRLLKERDLMSEWVRKAFREAMKKEPKSLALMNDMMRQAIARNEQLAASLTGTLESHTLGRDMYLTTAKVVELLNMKTPASQDATLNLFWESYRKAGKGRTAIQSFVDPGWKDAIKKAGFKNIDEFIGEVLVAYNAVMGDPELAKAVPDWCQRAD